jgi:hypothetical protein
MRCAVFSPALLALLLLAVAFGAGCAHDESNGDGESAAADDDNDASPADDDNDASPGDDDDNDNDDASPDDDDNNDDTSPGDDDDDDDNDDTTPQWIEPTAWTDFQEAERQLELANFSNAEVLYDSCVLKLLDDEPLNDGPVEPLTLERAEYAYGITLAMLPMRIIEYFVLGWLSGEDLVEMMRADLQAIGVDPDEQPTSLITVYLLELILPPMATAVERLDHARAAEDFVYRMPPFRFVFNNAAIQIPATTGADGRGEHGRAEAHLVDGLFKWIYSAALAVTAENLDTDAARIDDILQIIMSGDIAAFMDLLAEFPNLLTLRDDAVVDGPAFLAEAHVDFIEAISALHDDNDRDGHYYLDDNGTPLNPFDDFVDPGELPDDFLDSLRLETADQSDHIIRRHGQLGISLNVAINGEELGAGGPVAVFNLALELLPDAVFDEIYRSFMGFAPPEVDPINGLDDEVAVGTSTALSPTTLTDAAASFTPGALVGAILNPNVAQPEELEMNRTFAIVANTVTAITVDGDLTAVAQAGDTYTVGDGWIDDAPGDLSPLLWLLIGNFVPTTGGLGFYMSALYDTPSDVRDWLPLWDADAGNPAFYNFVVDQTETYTDVNGNGRYDPGVDPFVDAAHSFGGMTFPADGYFEPYYFYFPDPTMGDMLHYLGELGAQDPNDALNRVVSGLLSLTGGAQ